MAIREMQKAAGKHFELVSEGSGRAAFEIGAAFKGHVDVARNMVFGRKWSIDDLRAAQLCVELHDEWIGFAKLAIQTWLLIGRRLSVVKDVRLLIARMLRDEPWAWCKVKSG